MAVSEEALPVGEKAAARQRLRRTLSLFMLLGPVTLFMIVIFVISLVLLFSNSVFHFTGMQIERTLTLEAYQNFFTDPFFAQVLLNGFRVGGLTSILCILLGYPTAYAMTRIRNQTLVMVVFILVFSPLLTSVIVRSYGWLLLLADSGLINYLLVALKVLTEPVHLLFNFTGVITALVHVLLPFAVFPILSVLLQMDPVLKDAAADLGASRLRTFWHVTLPISLPGVLAAFQLTFVLAMSAFVTPKMLGGGRVMVLPIMIYENIADLNWPLASVQAMVLLALVLIIIFVTNWLSKKVYVSQEAET
jgi:putative spermidine/putrescine transport system permease protein